MRNDCMVHGCNKAVVAHGLCDMHRKRLSRHGHFKNTRPEDWGEREKHPLYNTWQWMKKMRHKFSIDERWEDFWVFVSDVGGRPSEKHQLRRIDNHGNYSPENCQWVETQENQNRAEYAKQWRKDNPDKDKNLYLRKRYGITLEDYSKMHREQNGVCAICGLEEPYNGYSLAVDHCHKTHQVRGLLCSGCNRGIGLLKDSTHILQKAINYLSQQPVGGEQSPLAQS